MTLEQRYGATLTAIAIGSASLVWLVIHTYAWEVTTLLMQRCPASLAVMFGSGFHFGSVCVLAVSLGVGVFVVLRLFFSFLKTYLRLSRLQALARPLPRHLTRLAERLGLMSTHMWYVQLPTASAMTVGVWRPRVVVSTKLVAQFPSAEVKAVLRHEKYHADHFHPVLILFGEVLASSLPFLPIVTEVVKRMKFDFELAADAAVINTVERAALAGALNRVREMYAVPQVGLGFAYSALEHRHSISQGSAVVYPRWSWLNTGISVAVVAGIILLCVLPRPVQAVTLPFPMAGGPFSSAVRYECAEIMSEQQWPMSLR